jgi:hypothetical protein
MAKANQVKGAAQAQPTTPAPQSTGTPVLAVPQPQPTATNPNPKGVTLEQVNALPDKKQGEAAPEAIALFGGNKSQAIRGMASLGLKAGPISKKLGIRYQHARNVLARPLKREIKEQRDANKKDEQQHAAPAGQPTGQQ